MRPSQYELPEIWSTTARPARDGARAKTRVSRAPRPALITTPWVRDAAAFLGTVAGSLTLLLGALGLFFPSLFFSI
jgi:hypothetical protein